MKLLKNDRSETGSGQCQEITGKGHQCTRDVVRRGFCKQHYRLRKEKGLIVDVFGTKPIEEMPGIPERLNPLGCQHFQIYCKYLMDQGRLYQIYLIGIEELCYLEGQLHEARKELREYGAVNFYESGPQVSGFATRYERVLRDIRNLRKDYGLTGASEIVQETNSKETPKQSYKSQKTKNF